jgi:hypothetical protein
MADLLEVERLAAVGRLWGKAKLFHPNIATRAIDWDGALVEAVAKTREARWPEDFRAAVDGLLAALGDPQTFSWAIPQPVPAPIAGRTQVGVRDDSVFKVIGNVVVLFCHRIARLVSRDGAEALEKAAPTLEGELAAARGVVLDCRAFGAAEDERASGYELDTYLRTTFAEKFRGSITLGTYRFREHSGHVSDIVVRGGSYWSAVATRVAMRGPRPDRHRPLRARRSDGSFPRPLHRLRNAGGIAGSSANGGIHQSGRSDRMAAGRRSLGRRALGKRRRAGCGVGPDSRPEPRDAGSVAPRQPRAARPSRETLRRDGVSCSGSGTRSNISSPTNI